MPTVWHNNAGHVAPLEANGVEEGGHGMALEQEVGMPDPVLRAVGADLFLYKKHIIDYCQTFKNRVTNDWNRV